MHYGFRLQIRRERHPNTSFRRSGVVKSEEKGLKKFSQRPEPDSMGDKRYIMATESVGGPFCVLNKAYQLPFLKPVVTRRSQDRLWAPVSTSTTFFLKMSATSLYYVHSRRQPRKVIARSYHHPLHTVSPMTRASTSTSTVVPGEGDNNKRFSFSSGVLDVDRESGSGSGGGGGGGGGESTVDEKRVLRRIDLRMLPLLGLLYSLALIDRSNLGVARIAGMEKDLGLSIGNRYSIISCVYFVPYTLLELPSNALLRRIGTRTFLTGCIVAWGAVSLSMAFVPSWEYLTFCRVLLGAFEAGFFPALVFIISTWYKRHEVQKRLAAFYLVSILTGGFSAIFAYALSLLEGKAGLSGWSWIFVIEGGITILFGITAYFYLPGFPDTNKFLSRTETEFILRRIEDDRGDALADPVTLNKVLGHLMDWKVWVFGTMFLCATIPAYAIGLFVTIILSGMGWDVKHSLLLSAPPYVFAAISVFIFAWLSDKHRHRAGFLATQTVITITGFLITGFVDSPGWRYFGLFLGNSGSSGCIPGILAYASNNIVSHSKRAVTTAVIISFGGVGGIIATTIFRQADFPRYLPGVIATISFQVLLLMLLGGTTVFFWRHNRAHAALGADGSCGFLYTL
ncbi:high-affinity nicotinic acid transporter [Moniliophthora roreri MCA 2997]|uniref:High-affinity nicotinic acid transporter n=1 Tax=Moniliophthora roreri (strain MCA 2997) TaxID=1381753 RepID=V2XXT2_MONRO|nr:high-affinity nicotinic acid transporter [Moniliophthora roreri MCA 2997]